MKMLMGIWGVLQRGPIIHPFLFAIYPILFLWSTNIRELSVFSSPADLLLPMAVIEIIALLLLALFWVILREWRITGLFVAFVLLLFFSYGHVLEALAGLDPGYAKNLYLVIIWPMMFVGGALLLLRFRSKLTNLTNPLNVMAVVLIIFTLPNTLGYSPPSATPLSEQAVKSVSADDASPVETGTLPDIWYITAEGYSSARTLKSNLGYDNTPFVDYLKRNGFYVAADSNSNYQSTQNSLASSLNMQTLQQMLAEDGDSIRKHGLYPSISDNKAMRFAREHGYKIVYLADRFPAGTRELGDTYYGCGSRRLGIHREGFADALLMSTALNPLLVHFGMLEPTLNELRVCDFFQLVKAKEIPGPKVVVIHLRVPGHPSVISPTGKVLTSVDTSGYYKQAFLDQLTWTNNQLVPVLDILLSDKDNPPVIVIQGDHGEPVGHASGVGEDAQRGRFGIMNAYHLPNGGDSLLYPSISPVNTFRVIFNYYLNADFDLLEDRSYYAPSPGSYDFTDVTNVVRQGIKD